MVAFVKNASRFDYSRLPEGELSRIVRRQRGLFLSVLAVGLLAHVFGLGANRYLLHFDQALNALGLLSFFASLFFWARTNVRYSFFGGRAAFALDTAAHCLILAAFVLDAHFCVTYAETDSSVTTSHLLWPFLLIELPLSLAYYWWFYERRLKAPSKIRRALGGARVEAKYERRLSEGMASCSIDCYRRLLPFAAKRLGLPPDAAFRSKAREGRIEVSADCGGVERPLDIGALIRPGDRKEAKAYRTLRAAEPKADLQAICAAIDAFQLNK